jgi:diguanylate cyclase (GGDEF)-like protein
VRISNEWWVAYSEHEEELGWICNMNINEICFFMEALPDASLLINYQGRILGANRNAVKNLKYSSSQIKELCIEDLVPDRFREAHKTMRRSFIMSTQQRAMGGDSSKYFPTKLADNSEIMSEISIGRLDVEDDEEDHLLMVILIDRTDKVRLEEELKKRANVDQLTEVYTRAYFLELLEKEMERSARYKRDLTLIYFDIDFFKHINDTYGHYIGDLVLRQVGDVCTKELRKIDFCGRLGGEEFVITLPETNIENAIAVANRLRLAIKNIKVPAKEDLVAVSASFGVTAIQPNEREVDESLKRADQALYRAKEGGRDRVEYE